MLLIASGTISISFWFAWNFGLLYKSLYDVKVLYPHGNSEKYTLAHSATKLFNEHSSNLKEFSSSSLWTFKFHPSSLKSKLQNLFLLCLSSAEHLEDLLLFFIMPTTTSVEYFVHISLSLINLYITIMCF